MLLLLPGWPVHLRITVIVACNAHARSFPLASRVRDVTLIIIYCHGVTLALEGLYYLANNYRPLLTSSDRARTIHPHRLRKHSLPSLPRSQKKLRVSMPPVSKPVASGLFGRSIQSLYTSFTAPSMSLFWAGRTGARGNLELY